jgi:hypothetical protein
MDKWTTVGHFKLRKNEFDHIYLRYHIKVFFLQNLTEMINSSSSLASANSPEVDVSEIDGSCKALGRIEM